MKAIVQLVSSFPSNRPTTHFGQREQQDEPLHCRASALGPRSLKSAVWLGAYEQRNVAIGLACGLAGRGQIGKGMWPKPDKLGDMFATKHAHLEAGATCAWVPSPSAAAIHALHYHRINVHAVQQDLKSNPPRPLTDLLAACLVDARTLTPAAILQELENNLQGILVNADGKARWLDDDVPHVRQWALAERRRRWRPAPDPVAIAGRAQSRVLPLATDRRAPSGTLPNGVDAPNNNKPPKAKVGRLRVRGSFLDSA